MPPSTHRFCRRYGGPLVLFALLGLSNAPAFAQSPPATRPSTRPVPTKVTTPPGYVRVDVGGRSFITLPADETWVRRAAAEIARPTPTTTPSDMIANLAAKRELVVAAVLKDLSAVAPSRVERVIDERIAPAWKELQTVRPAMVYVVSPAEHLKQALQAGWSDKRFRYNPAADGIEFDRSVSLQPDGMSDESAVAALFSPADAEAKRVSALARFVGETENQIGAQITSRAVMTGLSAFTELIEKEALTNLPRGEDQEWLPTGLAYVLAAKYMSILHGAPTRELVQAIVAAPSNAVFNASRIDLLAPLPKDQLKPELVDGYLEAKRRKSIAVMYGWLDQAGEGKTGPLIEAVVRLRPADGTSLVAAVKSATGVDLTADLSSN